MLNWSLPKKNCSVTDALIIQIRKSLSNIDQLLVRFGNNSLKDYFTESSYSKPQPLQEPDDLLDIVQSYVTPILGEQVAQELARDLRNYPVILTANHHGVDYFAQSFQGNFLFLLYRRIFASNATVAPIFSCSGVPLSNSSYPKGILIYDAIQPDSGELPFKLPVFPNKLNQSIVHAAPCFNADLVKQVLKQLDISFSLKQIPKRAHETVRDILNEEYLDPLVLEQPNYSAQATLLNNRLGKRVFVEKKDLPELIYVEFETIVSLLLKKDLLNLNSLVYRVFFDPDLRRTVIKYLNEKKGCWHYEKLTGLANGRVNEKTGAHLLAGYGSVFFWGLDVLGRHYPLTIIDSNDGKAYLVGKDGLGVNHQILFDPASVLAALDSKMIYPNLFTMFTVVSLARAVTCVGGYFQSHYLPVIQRGLVQALNSIDGYQSYAEAVVRVNTNFYLSGMMFLLAGVRGQFAVPAGPVEIISRGGLENGFLEELGSISLNTAHQIGLFNIYPDLFSRQERLQQWQERLAMELNKKNSKWVLPEITN